MDDLVLTFPTPARERAQLRAIEAHNTRGAWPTRMLLNAHDLTGFALNMRKNGYHNGKPLDVLNIPVVAGQVDKGYVRFVWE